jgi:uncharacterized protein YdaL
VRTLLVVLGLLSGPAALAAPQLNVCLYFDRAESRSAHPLGERSALMVGNLLGHFREVDAHSTPLGEYAAGALSRCDRAAYIGTRFDTRLPAPFLADIAQYRKPFLWMNYNIWKLQESLGRERFSAAWGFLYERIDPGTPPQRGQVPEFYSRFEYKGASFRKIAQFDRNGNFLGHQEILVVRPTSGQVLAQAIRPGDGARTPYALRKDNFFFIADNPTSIIDERDRYLILADLLFDFLGLAPRSDKRTAAIRIEDVHPGYDVRLLYQTVDVLRARKVPFAISLIPRYVGPLAPEGFDATESPRFLRAIRYALRNGGSILVHGYEHHPPADLGCGDDGSGEGYEFWDGCKGLPLPYDSAEYVRERLAKARKILRKANLPFVGWVTPHYMASPTGFRAIHQDFGRIMQRMPYFLDGLPLNAPNTLEQFFPYTIYRDYYGAHIWPENLGYVPMPQRGGQARDVDAMLEAARANKAVRDGWASLFWHPTLIPTELGIGTLERLIDGIRAEGYEFISLRELRNRGE